jgi:hypothetical protein
MNGLSYSLIFLQFLLLLPAIALFVLVVYALVLAIKALKIYIRKNS